MALVQSVADRFNLILKDWLTIRQLAEVRRRNRTPDYTSACATHDFCDANMAMAQAIEEATGRPVDPEGDTDLINRAWDQARAWYLGTTAHDPDCTCNDCMIDFIEGNIVGEDS